MQGVENILYQTTRYLLRCVYEIGELLQAKIRSRRGRSYVYRLWEEKAEERKAALMAGKVGGT